MAIGQTIAEIWHFFIFGRPFVKRFALCYQSIVCLSCPVCLSVTLVHCSQTVGWIKMKLDVQVGLGPGHIVLDGDPASPPPKGHSPHPIFGPYLLRLNGCMDQDVTWYGARPRPRRLCVRWGPSPPPPKGGRAPSPIFGPFLLWLNCWMHQDATWYGGIGLSPGDFLLDGDPALPPKFSAHVYYSYCNFVRALHNAQSLLVCSSSS